MSTLFTYLAAELRERWRAVRDTGDAGYSTEAVLTTALLVALAILVIGIIAVKVTGTANGIAL